MALVTGQTWQALRSIVRQASPPFDPETILQMDLRSTLGHVIGPVVISFRDWWHREDAPVSLRVTPPDEVRPRVPVAYIPLYTYLDRRYAATVVLTFDQIEALLGFALPSPGFADAAWWTDLRGANDRHTAAWTAARRRAIPRLGARIVEFERLP